jgi:hypothetical protein
MNCRFNRAAVGVANQYARKRNFALTPAGWRQYRANSDSKFSVQNADGVIVDADRKMDCAKKNLTAADCRQYEAKFASKAQRGY